ncbi:MAG: hypothetical protein ACRD0Y_02935 [Terriglobales bacterium]
MAGRISRRAGRNVSIAAVVVVVALAVYVLATGHGAGPPGAIRTGGSGCTFHGAKSSAGAFLGPEVGLGLLCNHGEWVPARQDHNFNDFPLTSASDIRTARANAEIAAQRETQTLRGQRPHPPKKP